MYSTVAAPHDGYSAAAAAIDLKRTTLSVALVLCTHEPMVNVAVIIADVHEPPSRARYAYPLDAAAARSAATSMQLVSDEARVTRASPTMLLSAAGASMMTAAALMEPCSAGRLLSAAERAKLPAGAMLL